MPPMLHVAFDDGLLELADWLRAAQAVDSYDVARRELEVHGLTI